MDDQITTPSESVSKRDRSRNHPTVALSRTTEFGQEAKRKLGYKPFSRKALGDAFSTNPSSGGFSSKIAATSQFGVFEDAPNGMMQISGLGKRIMDPISEADKRAALQEAFLRPPLYQELVQDFRGQRIPDELGNILLHGYRISPTAKDNCARVFLESARYAGLLNPENVLSDPRGETEESSDGNEFDFAADIAHAFGLPKKGTSAATNAKVSAQQNVVISLTDGKKAQLILPHDITTTDIAILEAQFAVFKLQAKSPALISDNQIDSDVN